MAAQPSFTVRIEVLSVIGKTRNNCLQFEKLRGPPKVVNGAPRTTSISTSRRRVLLRLRRG
jgi:hypothetical protein